MSADAGTLPEAEAQSGGTSPSLRTHADLAAENGGFIPWCGPAALALAAGLGYREAGERLRRIAPRWYPDGPVITAYRRDILGVLVEDGVSHVAASLPRSTLCGLARTLASGWYLARITDHFLLVRCADGQSLAYDNRHSGVPVSARTGGRRRVTHLVRLLDGPRPFRAGSDPATPAGIDSPVPA